VTAQSSSVTSYDGNTRHLDDDAAAVEVLTNVAKDTAHRVSVVARDMHEVSRRSQWMPLERDRSTPAATTCDGRPFRQPAPIVDIVRAMWREMALRLLPDAEFELGVDPSDIDTAASELSETLRANLDHCCWRRTASSVPTGWTWSGGWIESSRTTGCSARRPTSPNSLALRRPAVARTTNPRSRQAAVSGGT
jgi:hypothetical protein